MLLTNAYDPDPRVREEALALIAAGWEVRVLAWDRDLKAQAAEDVEGVRVERIFLASRHGRGTSQLFFYPQLYWRMFRRAWPDNFDVIHCHDLDTLPVGMILARSKRKPLVYDAHESFPDMLEGSVHPAVLRVLRWLERFLIRRTDLLITVGEKLRRHFEERGARRSVVVSNGKRLADYQRSEQQNLEVRRRLGIPAGALTLVAITQLFKDRKLEELFEALDGCPDVYLILGGKGDLERLVAERAALNPRIRYVGFVPAPEIPAYTCAGDVVYYGFDPRNPNAQFSAPNKLFEALAAGKPLITGDFGEIAEVVRRSSCGIILPRYGATEIREAIATLQQAEPRSQMASNARRWGREVANWDKSREVLCREYSGLAPERLEREARAGMALGA